MSLLPLSHLLEQAVGLYYALDRRGRHPVRPQPQPAGHLRCAARPPGDLDGRRAAGPRPVLERHRARGREARPDGARSTGSGRSPGTCRCAIRRLLFGSVHAPARRPRSGCSSRPGAFLPPALQQAWEDIGRHRPAGLRRHRDRAPARARRSRTTGPGTVGRPPEGIEMRLARRRRGPVPRPDRVQGLLERARGDRRRVHRGRLVPDRRHRPSRHAGRLILSGRSKDIIVLPNGFNVYPEDIENALRVAGIRDAVVRRDAARAGSRRSSWPRDAPVRAARTSRCALGRAAPTRPSSAPGSTRRSRPPTRPSGRTSASPAGGCGPRTDFPRTHTLKIKRDADPRLGRVDARADRPLSRWRVTAAAAGRATA